MCGSGRENGKKQAALGGLGHGVAGGEARADHWGLRGQNTAARHGQGVHVAYDGAGADTFYGFLAYLRYHGVLAYYGQTIKALPSIDLLSLPKSVLVTYPVVQHHATTRE